MRCAQKGCLNEAREHSIYCLVHKYGAEQCKANGCLNKALENSIYCQEHRDGGIIIPPFPPNRGKHGNVEHKIMRRDHNFPKGIGKKK